MLAQYAQSLSARRAWIEICALDFQPWTLLVALRKESVDRNAAKDRIRVAGMVALRKESVDRNGVNFSGSASAGVALRKESVDRHQLLRKEFKNLRLSLSARRAWIEIPAELRRWCEEVVALRKESVDRNKNPAMPSVAVTASLSARRAWIEILYQIDHKVEACRRSPQGERG